jgi:hypothetical protein
MKILLIPSFKLSVTIAQKLWDKMNIIVLFYSRSTFIKRITLSILEKQKLVRYRTLQKHSEHDTLAVSLPVQWTRLLGLRKADNVKVTFEDNKRIVVERTTD